MSDCCGTRQNGYLQEQRSVLSNNLETNAEPRICYVEAGRLTDGVDSICQAISKVSRRKWTGIRTLTEKAQNIVARRIKPSEATTSPFSPTSEHAIITGLAIEVTSKYTLSESKIMRKKDCRWSRERTSCGKVEIVSQVKRTSPETAKIEVVNLVSKIVQLGSETRCLTPNV